MGRRILSFAVLAISLAMLSPVALGAFVNESTGSATAELGSGTVSPGIDTGNNLQVVFGTGCTESWTYSGWSACSGGVQTRTAIDANSCGTTSGREALSRACTDGAGGETVVASAQTSYKEEVKKQEEEAFVKSVISGDTALQQAIKDVLGLKDLPPEKIDEIASVSAKVAKQITSSRDIAVTASGRTILTLSFAYSGTEDVKNFIIYDTVPKSFAASSDDVTVVAGGAVVRVIDKDPVYSFTYPTISKGESKAVSYSVNKRLDKALLANVSAPIFLAEKLEAPAVAPPAAPPAGEVPPSEKPPLAPSKYNWTLIAGIIIALLIVAAVLLSKGKAKKADSDISAELTKPKRKNRGTAAAE